MKKTMYLSKYALASSEGIKEIEVTPTGQEGYVFGPDRWNALKVGRDVHETWGQAAVHARAARDKKIASLKKQIAKLEKLSFAGGQP